MSLGQPSPAVTVIYGLLVHLSVLQFQPLSVPCSVLTPSQSPQSVVSSDLQQSGGEGGLLSGRFPGPSKTLDPNLSREQPGNLYLAAFLGESDLLQVVQAPRHLLSHFPQILPSLSGWG
jgi:hypothetical protein